MRIKIFSLTLLLTLSGVSAPVAAAQASTQTANEADTQPSRAEMALDYGYLHSNTLPVARERLNLNGGSASFAWLVKPGSSLPWWATSPLSIWPQSPQPVTT